MKKVISLILAIFFLIIAFWLGEAGKGLFQILPYLIVFLGIAAVSYLISTNWKNRVLSGSIFFILFAVAFYMGDVSFYRAFNNCIERAQDIRATLSEYKNENGTYPGNLDELNLQLTCSRCLRGTILKYESDGSHYKLWFKDWLVEHSATDQVPFLAHK